MGISYVASMRVALASISLCDHLFTMLVYRPGVSPSRWSVSDRLVAIHVLTPWKKDSLPSRVLALADFECCNCHPTTSNLRASYQLRSRATTWRCAYPWAFIPKSDFQKDPKFLFIRCWKGLKLTWRWVLLHSIA